METAENIEIAESKKRSVNQILIEQLMLNIGNISTIIENRGRDIFGKANLLSTEEISDYTLEFLELFVVLLQAGDSIDRDSAEYKALRQYFTTCAQQMQMRGGDLNELVRYIQFLQSVFINGLKQEENVSFDDSRQVLLVLASMFSEIVLDVFHFYLSEKERTIQGQQDEIRQTSTPITQIWDGVLTLPIIGTLDSSRTMMIMETLLSRIEAERARVIVMDVTGVLAIDTQVSHHLVQIVRAVGMMGAEAILTGIRPEVARALTSLNIDLSGVTTRASLSDGLKEAFRLLGITVSAATQI